uniref:glucose-6-phosphate 1-epimerase n=1 Tax=Cacopsylla melanoneura TaxID=428564 RepID=A0A8D8Q5D7_9HEMI
MWTPHSRQCAVLIILVEYLIFDACAQNDHQPISGSPNIAALGPSVVKMERGNNTSCTINLHGATVVSWRVNNQEQLFLSKAAVLNGTRPIRGGIPIVFPQFRKWGEWEVGPKHGFARNITWTVEKPPEKLPNGDVEATFSLSDNMDTRYIWDHRFKLTYNVVLSEKALHCNISVYNPSKEYPLKFHLLLHNYIKVPDVTQCVVDGLHGCHYDDKMLDGQLLRETRDKIQVTSFTDRVYQSTDRKHVISNVMSGKMLLKKRNLADTVLWHPWEKSRNITDMLEEEYPRMMCVEAGEVAHPVQLIAGNTYHAGQTLQVM